MGFRVRDRSEKPTAPIFSERGLVTDSPTRLLSLSKYLAGHAQKIKNII